MRKAAIQWLKSAEMDLDSIAQVIDMEHLTPVAAFHAQQCVEKCFKAILEEHSKKVPKIHSTLRLYGLIEELTALEVDMAVLTDLDDLYRIKVSRRTGASSGWQANCPRCEGVP